MTIMYNKICYNCGFASDPVLELIESVKYEYCPVCNSKLHKLNLFNGIKLDKMSINDKDAWVEQQTGCKISDELKQQRSDYIDAKIKAGEERRREIEAIKAAHKAAEQCRMNPNNIHCPTCGSNKIEKISGVSRAASVGVFGLASSKIGKTFECKSCGYKW